MNAIAPDSLPQAQLIEHLLQRYHARHREQLPELIRLASRVEQVHGHHLACPNGLADLLRDIEQELEGHMLKEEQVLFPMMRQGGHPMIRHPIGVMRHEHDTAADLLRGIEHATHGLALPDGACRSWTALYTGLEKFTADLVAHMHLENAVLFPRFEAAA